MNRLTKVFVCSICFIIPLMADGTIHHYLKSDLRSLSLRYGPGNKQDFAFVGLLKDCARRKDLLQGSAIHANILKRKMLLGKSSPYLSSALISMYAKCGAFGKARQVFETLPVRDVVSWNALIAGYSQLGHAKEALDCFERMQREGIPGVGVTFTCILKVCGSLRAFEKGRQIHDEIIYRGLLEKNIVLGNALVDMYAKCGAFAKAWQVFEELPARDVVSWSTLISAYAQEGKGHEALSFLEQMKCEGLSPNDVTFICILKACGSIGAVQMGKQIHDELVTRGLLGKNIMLDTVLVDMYARCGLLVKARDVLEEFSIRNVVCWNVLIAGYAQEGHASDSLNSFQQMQREGVSPNVVTFIFVLKACAKIGAIRSGIKIHIEIMNRGLLIRDIVLGSALVGMYAKCGVLAEAQQVLEELPTHDAVTWNTLIAGYVQHGQDQEALDCFARMQEERLSPNEITFTCILKACASTGAIEKGQKIHDEIIKRHLLASNVMLGTALVYMYAKCGLLTKAHQVLEGLPVRDIISWNALIGGYAQQGHGCEALGCIAQMETEGICPDDITLLCAVNACGHSGKLDLAQTYYETMSRKYGVTPKIEHHTCMVVISGFAGCFVKALALIKTMSSFNDSSVWLALLVSCNKWGNLDLAKLAFNQAIQLDENLAPAYVLMANIYAVAGLYKDEEKVEAMRMNNVRRLDG